MLQAALDEADHPLVIVDRELALQFANREAQRQLRELCSPVRLAGGALTADEASYRSLREAAADAVLNARRCALLLGRGAELLAVSVAPLREPCADQVLITLARRRICSPLTLRAFARPWSLTPSELRVLEALSRGLDPAAIAGECGVAVSTVRTQLCSVRGKTGTGSIDALLRLLAQLPPLAPRVA
jgi:DNA-binding CsgD family transcriptional regulator